MAIFNTESRLVGGKREAVNGTAETLVSADFNVRVREAELSSLEVEYSDSSKYLTGDHTRSTVTPGVARGTIDQKIQFEIGEWIATGPELTPTFTAKLPYAKYLESAGLVVTGVAPSDELTSDGYWTIVPQKSADCQTITEAIYDISTCDGGTTKGIEYKIAGAMSTLTIDSEKAGAPFMFNFSTKGKVSDVSEIAYANLPVLDDANTLNTPSVRMLNTDIEITLLGTDGEDIGSTPIAFCSNSFTLDTGNTLAEIMCQADAFGIKQSIITSREPMIKFSPLLDTLTSWDFWGSLTSESVYKIELINYADSAKLIPQLKIEAPRAQLVSASGSDDGGFRRLDQEFRLLRNVQGATPAEKEQDFKITIFGDTLDQTV